MVKVKALLKQALLKEENIKFIMYAAKVLSCHQLFKKYQKYRFYVLQCSLICEEYKSKKLWAVQRPPQFYVRRSKYINWSAIGQDKLRQTLLLSLTAL